MNLKLVFFLLILLTLLTSVLKVSSVLIALLILIKIGLILFYFMELHHAYKFFLMGIGSFILITSFILLLI